MSAAEAAIAEWLARSAKASTLMLAAERKDKPVRMFRVALVIEPSRGNGGLYAQMNGLAGQHRILRPLRLFKETNLGNARVWMHILSRIA